MRLWLLLVALAGCTSAKPVADGAVDGGMTDGLVYERCSAVCVRPSDCALAYPDDEFCPPGYRCSTFYPCGDGGMQP